MATERPERPERPHIPQVVLSSHSRNMSEAASESDSSISSPEPLGDEDTDFFMIQANDSQSSLGVPNLREMSVSVDSEREHRISPISKLPPELLLSIFARLATSADLRNCMLVSYHWALHTVGILWHRPLCNKMGNLMNVTSALSNGQGFFPYQDLVKRLNLSALNDKVSDGTVQAFQYCKRMERLTLTNCSNLTDQGVSTLVEGNKHLQALDVTDLGALTDHTLLAVADSCPKLQGLNVTNCTQITDESLVAVSEHCRQLKRLKLNNVNRATDISITSFAYHCRAILEIDLHACSRISSESVTALLSNLSHLRELRLAHCTDISDSAFVNIPPRLTFESLRILDLTACEHVRDDAIGRIIPQAPRLRNLVLAKCKNITDRAVLAICRLTKNLHYIHLGHCINLTDAAIIALVKACNRIRYIDLACCYRITDASVQHLATLPKLRRIGLVKCQQLTDRSILALARGPMMQMVPGKVGPQPIICSLERVHLSYCVNLTIQGIHALLHHCPRLTHLSLTGVQAFLREDLTQFCRDAPPEFTHPQRDVFCVFSGDGVARLRDHLNLLALRQAEREGQEAMEESVMDGDESAGADTISEDETIGEDGSDETVIGRPPPDIPMLNVPHHRGYNFHVEMPFLPADMMVRMGPPTPLGSLTPQRASSPAPPGFQGMGSIYYHGADYYSSRSPMMDGDDGDDEREPRGYEGHSRRHTLESAMDFYGHASGSGTHSAPRGPSPRPMEETRRRSLFGTHSMRIPPFLQSSHRRTSSRSRDVPQMPEASNIGYLGATGDLLMSSTSRGSRGNSSGRPEAPRQRSSQRSLLFPGPRLPSWGSSSRGEGSSSHTPPMGDDDRRNIMRAMTDPRLAHGEMEGVEMTYRPAPQVPHFSRPPGQMRQFSQTTEAMMEENQRFVNEAINGRGTLPEIIHGRGPSYDFLHGRGPLPEGVSRVDGRAGGNHNLDEMHDIMGR